MHSFYVKHKRITAPHSNEMITKQEYKDECNIYNILNQYQQTGIISHINENKPLYTDLPDSMDYQQSLEILTQAGEAFDALPSKVREHFSNDPGRFLAAFSDPSQLNYLHELGLVTKTGEIPPTSPSPEPSTPES